MAVASCAPITPHAEPVFLVLCMGQHRPCDKTLSHVDCSYGKSVGVEQGVEGNWGVGGGGPVKGKAERAQTAYPASPARRGFWVFEACPLHTGVSRTSCPRQLSAAYLCSQPVAKDTAVLGCSVVTRGVCTSSNGTHEAGLCLL